MEPTPNRMPAIYVSHGAPTLTEDKLWSGQLATWGRELPKPKAILIVSAHWEDAPIAIGATSTVPLDYDFWGFPQRYYEVRYAAPGAPQLAERVRRLMLVAGASVKDVPTRGLDHGAYVPLAEMYPAADVPVLQISMPTLDPSRLMAVGRMLAPLRDEGVLIVGSGYFTHSLRAVGLVENLQDPTPGLAGLAEFDDWGRQALKAGDVDGLLDFAHKAPAVSLAHPTTDHFAPLFVVMGAGEPEIASQRTVIDGFAMGNAKRSIQIG